jgi:hypothetical protein
VRCLHQPHVFLGFLLTGLSSTPSGPPTARSPPQTNRYPRSFYKRRSHRSFLPTSPSKTLNPNLDHIVTAHSKPPAQPCAQPAASSTTVGGLLSPLEYEPPTGIRVSNTKISDRNPFLFRGPRVVSASKRALVKRQGVAVKIECGGVGWGLRVSHFCYCRLQLRHRTVEMEIWSRVLFEKEKNWRQCRVRRSVFGVTPLVSCGYGISVGG